MIIGWLLTLSILPVIAKDGLSLAEKSILKKACKRRDDVARVDVAEQESLNSPGFIPRTFFNYRGDIKSSILNYIQHAGVSAIKIAIYLFTDHGIKAALIKALEQQVVVNIVADYSTTTGKDVVQQNILRELQGKGAFVRVWPTDEKSARGKLMHHKFMIVELASVGYPPVVVLHGSYNYTFTAARFNAETLTVTGEGGEHFQNAFSELWQASVELLSIIASSSGLEGES